MINITRYKAEVAKVVSVIESCVTPEQLHGALPWVNKKLGLYIKLLISPHLVGGVEIRQGILDIKTARNLKVKRLLGKPEDVEELAHTLNKLYCNDLHNFTRPAYRSITPTHFFRTATSDFREIDLDEECAEFIARVENYLEVEKVLRAGELKHHQAYYDLVRIAETRVELLGEREVKSILSNLYDYRIAYFGAYPKLDPNVVKDTLDACRQKLFAGLGVLSVGATDLETFVIQENIARSVKASSAKAPLGGSGRAMRLGKARRLGNG